jgi:hypothetical protein
MAARQKAMMQRLVTAGCAMLDVGKDPSASWFFARKASPRSTAPSSRFHCSGVNSVRVATRSFRVRVPSAAESSATTNALPTEKSSPERRHPATVRPTLLDIAPPDK